MNDNTEETPNSATDQMIKSLEATGDFRILRRLQRRALAGAGADNSIRRGLILDLETTGLDPRTDEIIELAMVPFLFDSDGIIVGPLPAFDRLREPSLPIPPRVTALTGLTDAMVAGHTIDPDEIAALLAPAEIIIAHNARFDRAFAERLHPAFAAKPWACSMSQVGWEAHGFEGLKLKYLLTSVGLFQEGHRALDDAHAVLELLSRPLGVDGRTALSHLLQAAATPTVRIWAIGAPFEAKDQLRARAYRWNNGDDGRARAWFLDLDHAALDAEVSFLRREIFRRDWSPLLTKITAHDRFSERV